MSNLSSDAFVELFEGNSILCIRNIQLVLYYKDNKLLKISEIMINEKNYITACISHDTLHRKKNFLVEILFFISMIILFGH